MSSFLPGWSSPNLVKDAARRLKEDLARPQNELSESVLSDLMLSSTNIKFKAISYIPAESVDLYANRLERAFDQANPAYENVPKSRLGQLRDRFVDSLPEPFRTGLLESFLLTFDQCKVTARQFVAATKLSME